MVTSVGFCEQLLLDNNLKVVDLRDMDGDLPLDVVSSTQILWRTEAWEYSTWDPLDANSVGYPSLVYNDRGPNPDYKYYLYYAHHDPTSGIGCAVADTITGPYIKLAELDPNREDSQVLVNPHYPAPLHDPSHYSTPSVVWNEDEQLWFMYFHYYNHYYFTPECTSRGLASQLTALATCPDLAANTWTPWESERSPTIPRLVPVLPTSTEAWINNQSSYHAVQRLPEGQWLAFLRGTSDDGSPPKIGIATSDDGRIWDFSMRNPVIHQNDGGSGRMGVYRPGFIGYLGDGEYLAAWSESHYFDASPNLIYGRTTDFINFERDSRGYASWLSADGLISPWRVGNTLYLFAGKYLHTIQIPVRPEIVDITVDIAGLPMLTFADTVTCNIYRSYDLLGPWILVAPDWTGIEYTDNNFDTGVNKVFYRVQ